MRSDEDRLKDILEAINRIERYAAFGRERFDTDELIQTWVLHHLTIIGEAARSVSDELRSEHPEVPWGPIARTRNILVHVYFGVDLDRVWAIVEKDLPALKNALAAFQAKD